MQVCCKGLGIVFPGAAELGPVLRDISFRARDGEFVCVVGPSGCGKTTLLRTLAGLLSPAEGVVERIPAPSDHNDLALLVFQENSLFPWMTVLENATYGLRMQGCGKAEREARAMEMLKRFGVAGREQAYPRELSLGMKQRVAVIRAFLSDPAVLLMDEPFAALDYQTRLSLHQELLELWEQSHKTVVFVTHDVDEAILLGDRILVLYRRPASVIAELKVDFPRPRDVSLTLEEDFLVLKRRIWTALGRALFEPSRPADGPGRGDGEAWRA